jgi:gluconolactonase
MIRTLIATMVGVGMLGAPLSHAGEPGVLAPGATVEKAADGFKFTEGPTCDASGNLFFTDQPNDRILKWSADGELTTFLQPAGRSNGMYFAADGRLIACADEKIGSPDGKTLYVADIGAKNTWRYDVQDDGSLAGKTLLCEQGSDGMTLDDEGNVYLTGPGVLVFDKTGKQIEHIKVPEPWTANVSFCGKDRQTLFITASKGLYSVRTRTRAGTSCK